VQRRRIQSGQAQDTGAGGVGKEGRNDEESRADLVSEIELAIGRLSGLASAELAEVLGLKQKNYHGQLPELGMANSLEGRVTRERGAGEGKEGRVDSPSWERWRHTARTQSSQQASHRC